MMATKSKQSFSIVLAAFTMTVVVTAASQPSAQEVGGARDSSSKSWQAVAPGVVEPRSGVIKILASVIGRISEIPVKMNDKVLADERLVRLDDEAARARVASAQAEVAMRQRERDDKAAGRAADRRDAEDAVADAEQRLVDARDVFDRATFARRAGSGSDATVAAARAAWTSAGDDLNQHRAQLRKVESQSRTPLPTEAEGQVNIARSELRRSIAELERLTIRAPIESTVLQVNAKVGELASPTSAQPLILLGDLSRLRIRAELDEHDIGKIKVGDQVVVGSDAFPDREVAGRVAAIAPIVDPGRIDSRASRTPAVFSVADVLIDVSNPGPLVVGMKVDVYFQLDSAAQNKGILNMRPPGGIRAPF